MGPQKKFENQRDRFQKWHKKNQYYSEWRSFFGQSRVCRKIAFEIFDERKVQEINELDFGLELM